MEMDTIWLLMSHQDTYAAGDDCHGWTASEEEADRWVEKMEAKPQPDREAIGGITYWKTDVQRYTPTVQSDG
jgi:hypothetical protein